MKVTISYSSNGTSFQLPSAYLRGNDDETGKLSSERGA
jgi:hypothetical protein